MDIKTLLAEARKAIEAGDLEKADKLTEQIKRLKALGEYESQPPAEPTAEMKALQAELDDLKAFKEKMENEPAGKAGGTLVVTEDETDKKATKPWKSAGHFLMAVADAARYPHQMDERLKAQKAVLGQSEGVPADGGYLLEPTFAGGVRERMHSTGEISQRITMTPIGPNSNSLKINAINETSRVNGSRWGGIRGYWLSEGAPKVSSDLEFRQIELVLKKLAALLYSTDELLADTTALGAIVNRTLPMELNFLFEDSVINGTGAGQPLGILNSPALVTVAKEAGQAADTVVTENVVKMWSRMFAPSRRNAVWLINQDVEPQLWTMTLPIGTGGMATYMPPGGLSQSPYSTLMGRPVIPVEYAATVGDVGDIILADFGEYIAIDKGGVESASSIHVQFLTDQTVFRFVYRVDGQPAWNAPLTPYKGSNTLSPFVALAARS